MNEEQLAVLPESVRDWDEAKNSETPEIFWDRINNIRSKLGTGIYKPGEDAGKEDWTKFIDRAVEISDNRLMPKPNMDDPDQLNALFTSLGRPEDSSGYELEEVEGAKLNEDREKFIREIAFKANLTKSQLKLLDKEIRTADVNARNSVMETLETDMKGLRQEWGLAFDERIHAANKIATTFFTHLGDKPNLSAHEIRAFYSIAKQLGQGNTEFKEQGDQGSGLMTPSEAAVKISEIRNNKEHPYHNVQDPAHKVAKKRMRELYLIKNNMPPE